MFRYCSQFELKMNLQTDTTLNGNFDNFNFDKLHRSFNFLKLRCNLSKSGIY